MLHVFTDVARKDGVGRESWKKNLLKQHLLIVARATSELEVRTVVAGAALQFLHTDGAHFLLRIGGS